MRFVKLLKNLILKNQKPVDIDRRIGRKRLRDRGTQRKGDKGQKKVEETERQKRDTQRLREVKTDREI